MWRAAPSRRPVCHRVVVAFFPPGRLRAVALLVLAVAVGIGAAVLVRGGDTLPEVLGGADTTTLRPGAEPGEGFDPLAYDADRKAEYERRAAAGLAHVLFAKSPGGVVATAERVAGFRPLVEAAALAAKVDPDLLEAIVFLESAGRPEAQAGGDLDGAVGLTQILAETGQNLLGMQIDVQRSEALTRGIRRGRKVEKRKAERKRVDERFDPAKALAATVRYLEFARGDLDDRDDLAVVSYHMGVGNLKNVLDRFDADEKTTYTELFFTVSPLTKPEAYAKLAALGDDSSTYLWRVRAAEQIMRDWRADPAALAREARLQTSKSSAEELLHPPGDTERFATPDALAVARAAGTVRPLDAVQLGGWGFRIDPQMGELAPKIQQNRSLYRGLRPEALAVLRYLGTGVQEISGAKQPLRLTSTVRDQRYQRLLTRENIEATRNYSLHTTGFTFDVLRRYESKAQAQAFQFLLDRLTALNLIAWVREPAAIHVTVAGEAEQLLRGR